jgi:chromobox protein 1
MEGAADVLAEYHEEIGGRPQPKGMKRKAAPTGGKSESGTPAASSKRGRPADDKPAPKVEKAWSPPPGSWEHDVSYVDTVEELSDGVDPKTGNKRVQAYVVWKNQRKTSHPLRLLYQKCPQKVWFDSSHLGSHDALHSRADPSQMLMYYETHLVFTTIDSKEDTNGGTAMQNS